SDSASAKRESCSHVPSGNKLSLEVLMAPHRKRRGEGEKMMLLARSKIAAFAASLMLVAGGSPALAAPPAKQTQSSASSSAQTAPIKGPSVEGVTEYDYPNGFKLLLVPDASKPTVTVNITYFVGSRHEGYGETGMAHLIEHMVFKGTPTTTNVPKALNDHGARWNGSTTLDRTNYFETMPATAANLEPAIVVEA